MIQLKETGAPPARALLVGIQENSRDEAEAQSLFRELAELTSTLGTEILHREMIKVRDSQPKYGIGLGNAERLAEMAKELEADCIIFDQDITPSQQRNWEKLSGVSAIDRQEVIIQIFGARARTKEASLQVELARLRHALPRLSHAYVDLSRQRGGHFGTKGSGETKLETDRRTIQRRIHQLKDELEEVRSQRATQRKKREREPIPSCAIVGYTNAGKSCLLNAMTSAQSLVEDKLFATLDPTTRRLELGKGRPILLTDTVGFIRRLPHDLVDAFRSTLEEAALSDLILQVLDASDADIDRHFETTLSVLKDLGAEQTPRLVILNKIDLIPEAAQLEELRRKYSGAICISAKSGAGLAELAQAADQALSGLSLLFRLPADRHDLAALLHRSGSVLSEDYTDTTIEIRARVGDRVANTLKEYIVEA